MDFKLSLLFALIYATGCLGVDDTLVERTFGADVADAVVRRITRNGLFPDDQNFLRRLGFTESFFGEDSKTYRPGYFGGIWQLDEEFLNATKTLTLPEGIYDDIRSRWGIDWQAVVWNDLLKPFYSGLAARLYIQHLVNDGKTIPGTVDGQAQYWVDNYRRDGQVTVFTSRVRALESDPVCEGMMDLCVVLDGSSSVGFAAFEQAKTFVADLVATFSPDTVRVSFIIYGDAARAVFDFQNNLNDAQMDYIIRNQTYLIGQQTNTPAGLLMAVDFYKAIPPRNGVPQVVATFTDGLSNRGNLPGATVAVRNASLISFAVGISDAPEYSELLQISLLKPSQVFMVNDFDALAEFFYQMNSAVCQVPQTPTLGSNHSSTLKGDERRYFKYELPTNGLKFQITGAVRGWYSLTEEAPNSAVHDDTIEGGKEVVINTRLQGMRQEEEDVPSVFITVESSSGGDGDTEIVISSEELPQQNTTPSPTVTTTTQTVTTPSPTVTTPNSTVTTPNSTLTTASPSPTVTTPNPSSTTPGNTSPIVSSTTTKNPGENSANIREATLTLLVLVVVNCFT